jgi:hypothetical protein
MFDLNLDLPLPLHGFTFVDVPPQASPVFHVRHVSTDSHIEFLSRTRKETRRTKHHPHSKRSKHVFQVLGSALHGVDGAALH